MSKIENNKIYYDPYNEIRCDKFALEKFVKESEEKDKIIADLEAKLAESEENNKLLEMQLQDMERSKLSWENQYFTLYNTLKNYREVTEKKHLLDETEWQHYCAYKYIEPQIKGCLDREKELKQQLAEKEKEIEKSHLILDKILTEIHTNCYSGLNIVKFKEMVLNDLGGIVNSYNQDKISFAVEQLEKVKESLNDYDIQEILSSSSDPYGEFDENCVTTDNINTIIDNQIKQLKEMK